MDLFDIDDAQRMSREEAAAKLHGLADALAKNNSVEFHRAGRRITVRIPDQVDLKQTREAALAAYEHVKAARR